MATVFKDFLRIKVSGNPSLSEKHFLLACKLKETHGCLADHDGKTLSCSKLFYGGDDSSNSKACGGWKL